MDRFQEMQVFLAVAEEQGFAAAARRLNMSPPSVTRAVAALEGVKNPARVALKVMESPHLLLAGEGAQRFARVMGFPPYDPICPENRARFERLKQLLAEADRGNSELEAWTGYDWRKAWNFPNWKEAKNKLPGLIASEPDLPRKSTRMKNTRTATP